MLTGKIRRWYIDAVKEFVQKSIDIDRQLTK